MDQTHRAKQEQNKGKSLTLDFDGALITPDLLKKAVSAFVELLKAVSSEVCGRDKKVQWNMSLEQGSLLVVARPVADTATIQEVDVILNALPEGLSHLENGSEVAPKYFDQKALRAARDLASLPSEARDFGYVKVRSSGKGKALGERTVSAIDRLLGGQHQALGSIEGTLSTLTERGSLQFVVYDSLYDKGVNCFLANEDVMEKAVQAFRQRVAVSGMVQYDKEGRPVSIRVEDIRVFKDVSTLPSIKSLRGLFLRAQ